MKNITVTLDEKTAAWVRVHAARLGKSVSRLLGELLQKQMHEDREYFEAKRRFMAVKPMHGGWADERKPTREELNVRPRFR